ncbi:NAD(P)-binding protein [Imleria badia]|nr:NAD(P)-binding protein [Imleria badia]
MNIAVTGCNGRVGQRVVLSALQINRTVVGIDNVAKEDTEFRHDPHFVFVPADLTSFEEALKAFQGRDAISVNVLRAVYSVQPQFDYFPIDERHPTLPDEPYGLSKLVAEMQADTIVRRYPNMRMASLRFHWLVPTRTRARQRSHENSIGDLWGYVQEDSSAEAFVRALTVQNDEWKGHEKFFITAHQVAPDEDWLELKQRYFPDVSVREGWVKNRGSSFFDCSKAECLFGWVHRDYA